MMYALQTCASSSPDLIVSCASLFSLQKFEQKKKKKTPLSVLQVSEKKKKNTTQYCTPSPGAYLYPSNTLNKLFTRVAILIFFSFAHYCLEGLIMWRTLCLCTVPPPRATNETVRRRLSTVYGPTMTTTTGRRCRLHGGSISTA